MTVFRLTHRYLFDQQAEDRFVSSERPIVEVLSLIKYLWELGECLPENYRMTESINPSEIATFLIEVFSFTESNDKSEAIEFDIYSQLEGGEINTLYCIHNVSDDSHQDHPQMCDHIKILKGIYKQTRNIDTADNR